MTSIWKTNRDSDLSLGCTATWARVSCPSVDSSFPTASLRIISSSGSIRKGGALGGHDKKVGLEQRRYTVLLPVQIKHELTSGAVITWRDLENALQTCEHEGLSKPEGLPSAVDLTPGQKQAILTAIGDQLLEGKPFSLNIDKENLKFKANALRELAYDADAYHQLRLEILGDEGLLRRPSLGWEKTAWQDYQQYVLMGEPAELSEEAAGEEVKELERLDDFHYALLAVYEQQLMTFRPLTRVSEIFHISHNVNRDRQVLDQLPRLAANLVEALPVQDKGYDLLSTLYRVRVENGSRSDAEIEKAVKEGTAIPAPRVGSEWDQEGTPMRLVPQGRAWRPRAVSMQDDVVRQLVKQLKGFFTSYGKKDHFQTVPSGWLKIEIRWKTATRSS